MESGGGSLLVTAFYGDTIAAIACALLERDGIGGDGVAAIYAEAVDAEA